MEKKILVTGANGFLGKRLLRELMMKKTNHIHCLASNLLDYSSLSKEISKLQPNVVFHLAAYVDLSRDRETAIKCFDVNLKGTFNLLEAVSKINIAKLIFSSTEEVYGDNKIPFKISQIPAPPSSYSVTKLAGENLCRNYADNFGFDLGIFRIATFYGPEMPEKKYFSQVIKKALDNQPILTNSGLKKRDYVYVDDVIEAFISYLKQEISKTHIFNIGGAKSYRLKDVIKTIVKLTHSRSSVKYNQLAERNNEANEWLMDTSLTERILHWQPKTSLTKGLRKTIQYFSSCSTSLKS